MHHTQPVLNLFPADHPFITQHAALRTREQMIHVLVGGLYSDYGKENPMEVQTALVSLKSLFADCQELATQMCADLGETLDKEMWEARKEREESTHEDH